MDNAKLVNILEPNRDLVEQINSFWSLNNDNINWEIEFFGKNHSVDKGFGLDFNEIRQGEVLLNSIFEILSKENLHVTEMAVIALDSIYHTRLDSPVRVALNLHEEIKKGLIDDIKNAEGDLIYDCVNRIAVIDKNQVENGKYLYSFATKFCNRINPDKFPIFDSYVAGLLDCYKNNDIYVRKLKENSNKLFNQSNLGNYRIFCSVYNSFSEAFGLNQFNFKQLDIFMWTYGKLLGSKTHKKYNNKPIDVRLSITYIPNK